MNQVTIKIDSMGAVALYKILAMQQLRAHSEKSETDMELIIAFCQEIKDQIKTQVSTLAKEEGGKLIAARSHSACPEAAHE